jgi:hypothetical protein
MADQVCSWREADDLRSSDGAIRTVRSSSATASASFSFGESLLRVQGRLEAETEDIDFISTLLMAAARR